MTNKEEAGEGESMYMEKKHKETVRRLDKMKGKGFILTGEKRLTPFMHGKGVSIKLYIEGLSMKEGGRERGLYDCLRGCQNMHV